MRKIKNLTSEQKRTHDLAVKLRKLPDKQLVERLKTQPASVYKEESPNKVEDFLRELSEENLRGIGKITIKKIGEFAKEKGYI